MAKKKWKKRLKKIAKAALIGGALYAAHKGLKGARSKARSKAVAGTDDAGIGVTHSALTDSATNVINPNAAKAAAAAAANTGSNFQTKYSKKIGDRWMTPNQIRLGNINPHEATAAAGAAYTSPRVRTGLGPRRFVAKGGSAYKKGGRIRKQFGGALPVGGTARRDMRSGYYPSDMGMRGGPMYKKGGRVTGIAKRGFGRALMKGKK